MKHFLCALLILSFCPVCFAQFGKEITDAEQLGTVAGLASACKAKKLDDFELIASRILANQSKTDEEELKNFRIYASTKYTIKRRHKQDPQMTCSEIIEHFNKLPLFDSVVYADGSVKLSDGTLSKPQRPLKLATDKKNASKTSRSTVRSR